MSSLDVLAIGAHPDDVELCCGGTLAVLAASGRRTGILHLTSGEAGTRGTAERRRQEAERAAEELGSTVEFLDCGDGALRSGEAEQEALIEVLRRLRPEIVLGPTPSDRHPDHGRAHTLVRESSFYAGLVARGAPDSEPFRPGAVFSYMQNDPFEPSFIVDVTSGWERKLASLAAYESQLYQGETTEDGPETKVASKEFFDGIVGRARYFGQIIGAEYGEPFWSRLPLAVGDPMTLLPGGIR